MLALVNRGVHLIPLQAVHFKVIQTVHLILIYPVHLKVIWAVHLKCCNHHRDAASATAKQNTLDRFLQIHPRCRVSFLVYGVQPMPKVWQSPQETVL